ncbi:4-galactosyl-N-acetylglucosaminide 3-alpha-L-fucosyltransferase FUT5-like [Haliotis asinina]|uniref:4-galactosyl-N-acetylglucosaminide 3-alpha-L-fucosyltransferase FUT5-like n=1 Tax=Haliotis asinina TaxID=109174 RepID=UPI003531AD05
MYSRGTRSLKFKKYPLITEDGDGNPIHLSRQSIIQGDMHPASDITNVSSSNIDKFDAARQMHKEPTQRTTTGVNVTMKTLQKEYRHVPDIAISMAEKKSLAVLLERGVIEPSTDLVTTDTKVILWYIPTRYHPVMARLHPLRGCPESRCRVTTNRAFYNQSEALIFTAQLLDKIPPEKLKNQVWVLHNHESPKWSKETMHFHNEHWSSKFNWTMDYRADADIRAPYAIFQMENGTYLKREREPSRNYSQIWSLKEGAVAWVVSSCKTMSRRMEYVQEMSKYIQIDIYGHCGNKQCPRSEDESCLNILSKKYKFYLAFENALCKDYITEKFFHYYNSDMIIVARGGGNYSDVAPPGTFINAADFESPQRLAQYLNDLADNERDYVDILRRKNQYQPIAEEYPIVRNGHIVYMTYHYDAMAMCDLCERLWHAERYKSVYTDIGKWFDKGLCFHPQDLS